MPSLHYLALGLFYAFLLYFLIVDPQRCIETFVLGVPIIFTVQFTLAGLRGVNSETIVVVVLVLAAIFARSQKPTDAARNPLVPSVSFLIGLLGVSMLVSYATGSAQDHDFVRGWHPMSLGRVATIYKGAVTMMLVLPLAFHLLWEPEQVRRIVRQIAIVASVLSLDTLWSFGSLVWSGQLVMAERAAGLVAREPNQFGALLALTLAVLVPLILDREVSRNDRALFLVAACTTGGALVCTLSRGAWLALLVALAYIAVFRGARAAAVVILLAVSAGIWIPESAVERVQSTVYEYKDPMAIHAERTFDGSTRSRLARWSNLPGQWLQAPFAGHGYMSYPRVSGEIGRLGEARAAHSTIIKLLVENGLLGILAYGWLLVAILRVSRRARGHPDGFVRCLAAAAAPAVLCLFAADVTGERIFSPSVTVFFWVIWGAVARMGVEALRAGPQAAPSPVASAATR